MRILHEMFAVHKTPYLDLWSGYEQRDVLVPLAGQQRYSNLPVLDLNTVDLKGQRRESVKYFNIKSFGVGNLCFYCPIFLLLILLIVYFIAFMALLPVLYIFY